MTLLRDFYFNKVAPVFPSDRYKSIWIIDDVAVVNFDCLYDREGNIRGTDQLIYQLHKHGIGKRFIFLSEDGALIQLSGAVEVIKNIINCFNLTAETCLIVSREQLHIDNADTICNEAIPYWCATLYETIKDISIHTTDLDKKFAIWLNRGTFSRAIIAQHLYNNYQDDSFISYQEQGVIVDRNLREYFEELTVWTKSATPIVYDQLWPNRTYDFEMIVGSSRKPYSKYFLEIVCETDIITGNWITEKTVKNLYVGKPFLIMAAPHTLEKIKSYGFKTFHPYINEAYDQTENSYTRLELIKQEIDRISKMSYCELNLLNKQMIDIYQYNRNIFLNLLNEKFFAGRG